MNKASQKPIVATFPEKVKGTPVIFLNGGQQRPASSNEPYITVAFEKSGMDKFDGWGGESLVQADIYRISAYGHLGKKLYERTCRVTKWLGGEPRLFARSRVILALHRTARLIP